MKKRILKTFKFFSVCYISSIAFVSGAQELVTQPLPEPLTLTDVMSYVESDHPMVQLEKSDLELSRATFQDVKARDQLKLDLNSRLFWVEPSSESTYQSHGDASIGLSLHKKLYDSGRDEDALNAAKSDIKAQQFSLQAHFQQRAIQLIEAYFDVLLADLEYVNENEAMAIAFLRFDEVKDKVELGRESEVLLLEKESIYLKSLRLRTISEKKQRNTRQKLALLLGRPNQLSSILSTPVLNGNKRKLPEFEKLLKDIFQNNLRLKQSKQKLSAARLRVNETKGLFKPVINAEIQANAYSRKSSSRDPVSAGITISVPLIDDSFSADTARFESEFNRIKAQMQSMRYDLQQQALELWQNISVLQLKKKEMLLNRDFRELSLDRQRALYETERDANLGNALVNSSLASLQLAQTEFELAVAWAELDALTGATFQQIGEYLLNGKVQ